MFYPCLKNQNLKSRYNRFDNHHETLTQSHPKSFLFKAKDYLKPDCGICNELF